MNYYYYSHHVYSYKIFNQLLASIMSNTTTSDHDSPVRPNAITSELTSSPRPTQNDNGTLHTNKPSITQHTLSYEQKPIHIIPPTSTPHLSICTTTINNTTNQITTTTNNTHLIYIIQYTNTSFYSLSTTIINIALIFSFSQCTYISTPTTIKPSPLQTH